MGFYLRKSVRLGPLRFNLSKSGIGVSAGIKGLRLGTGPRGNYIHMGRGGLYYRKTLSDKPSQQIPNRIPSGNDSDQFEQIQDRNEIHMEEIESSDVTQMVDSSSEALLSEIREKASKLRFSPIVAWIGFPLSLIALFSIEQSVIPVLLFAIAGILFFAAKYRDKMAKTVILMYDLEEDFETKFRGLYESFESFRKAFKIWHVGAKGKVNDTKYHAGANEVVRRTAIRPELKHPPFIRANIPTPSIPVGKQTLYLFPDKLLVYEGNKVGAVSYEKLKLDIGSVQFVEDEGVPRDAKVVDHTWRYVNKKGGPDKRFKDNKQLPIALYQTVHFTSNTGLNELLHVSSLDVSEAVKESILKLVASTKV